MNMQPLTRERFNELLMKAEGQGRFVMSLYRQEFYWLTDTARRITKTEFAVGTIYAFCDSPTISVDGNSIKKLLQTVKAEIQ